MSKEDHRRLFETFCKERYYGKGTSKTVTEEKAKAIQQAIKGEQGGSVTASFKHWVNRTKQFKLLSYPELELTDVLCLPAKVKVLVCTRRVLRLFIIDKLRLV
mgnify:CR=1 FL=1